jgi:hypothetical protein
MSNAKAPNISGQYVFTYAIFKNAIHISPITVVNA